MIAYRALSYYLFYQGVTRLEKKPPRELDRLPTVTAQIPIYNERYVAARCIRAVCSLNYPKSLLQVQVLDDSIDDTRMLCQQEVASQQRLGLDIEYLSRPVRNGFKAGALGEGLATAKGEFVAIFDADFIPQPDFLRRALAYFTSDEIGLVQGRWTHLNEEYSILTRAEASNLDYHFLIEQAGRDSSGLFLNFNGTAGVWRKRCILDTGGWRDTLAEDMDLSIRAQLRGWKLRFVPSLHCPSELPVEMVGARRQRFRWSKGATECGRRYLPTILRGKVSPIVKANILTQLTQSAVSEFVLGQFLLLPFLMRFQFNLTPAFLTAAPAPIGCVLYYAALRKMYGRDARRKISSHMLALLFHSGLLVNNAKAFLEGLLGFRSDFLRTPKYGIVSFNDQWRNKRYRICCPRIVVVETAFAIYGIVSMLVAVLTRNFLLLPYISIVTLGLLCFSLLSIYHSTGVGKRQL